MSTTTRTRALKLASTFLALGLGLAASAHEGGHDARGIVKAVTTQELTVETSKGVEHFVLTAQTEFVKNGSPATAQDLKESDRVVVHAKRVAGKLEAFKVQSAAPKKR